MKLALISGEFPPLQGGVGDYSRELALEFARRGLALTVITSAPAPPPATARGAARSLQAAENAEGTVTYALQYANLRSFLGLWRVDRLTRDCDAVHIQYQAAAYGMTPPIHWLPRFLRRRTQARKLFVTFHDLNVPYLFPRAGPLRWQTLLYLARSCDGVVVTNQEDFQRLSGERGWMAAQNRRTAAAVLRLIPIGSNITPVTQSLSELTATLAGLGVQPGETLLCYFGFLNASKDGETLVRVLANIIRAGYNARLLMLGGEIGASDPTNVAYAQRVRALIRELGVSSRVIWTGYRPPEEVSALWQAADIALLPYADGASLRRGTLLAALAHGLPIVSTTPRVAIEQLRDGENILLAAPHDDRVLAGHVMALAASPELRAKLSQGALRLAEEFSWSRIADQHLALYEDARA